MDKHGIDVSVVRCYSFYLLTFPHIFTVEAVFSTLLMLLVDL
jgi:hypothetical protein